MAGACRVAFLRPVESCLYMAPQAASLEELPHDGLPPRPAGCLRIVCISDTHNEHEGLRLPPGDILLHVGDVLTESGQRYVVRDGTTNEIRNVDPRGVDMFRRFAEWFGKQRFPHRVLVAGNHDMVLEGLGKKAIQGILSEACKAGEAVYLEGQEAVVGGVRIYGSPYGTYWHPKSKNDAFSRQEPVHNIQPGVHIVATHFPGCVPSSDDHAGVEQTAAITRPMFEAGALLHVSGHLHKFHGLHFAELENEDRKWRRSLLAAAGTGAPSATAAREPASRIPCLVASVAGPHFHRRTSALGSSSGRRGDPTDAQHGGYNLMQSPIVCDFQVPEVDQVPQSLPPPHTWAAAPSTAAGTKPGMAACSGPVDVRGGETMQEEEPQEDGEGRVCRKRWQRAARKGDGGPAAARPSSQSMVGG